MLLSAKWCRWCHLYESQTLESVEISKEISKHYVAIYVDADKRQDLTRKYLSGGYPTTVLFNARGEKMAGFSGHLNKNALSQLLWDGAAGKYEAQVEKEEMKFVANNMELNEKNVDGFLHDYNSKIAFMFDDLYGGFGKDAKYPNTYALDYALVEYLHTNKKIWKGIVEKSLEGLLMIKDGEEDGFFRYSGSRDWSDPHHEKMLRENSQYASIFLKAGKVLDLPKYTQVAESTLKWMQNFLYDKKEGGFFGSQDADEYYYSKTSEERKKLKAPFIDKTKYCEWNAEAVLSFLYAHKILSKLEYFEIADKTLQFMEDKLISENGALHYFDELEGAKLDGILADNAWGAIAFLEAFRIGKQKQHLDIGIKLIEYSIENLYSKELGAFIERNSKSSEMFRRDELKTGKTPKYENAIMCWALLTAYAATLDKKYLSMAKRTLANFISVEEDIDCDALVAQVARNAAKLQ